MGNVDVKQQPISLDRAVSRAEKRGCKLTISGRYHRLPKRIEDDYTVSKKVLGTGCNGSVLLANGTSKKSQAYFAVKGFSLLGCDAQRLEELETEVEIFLAMDHPHVGRLIDAYEDGRRLYLVMECMHGGELFERVREQKQFSEADAAHAINQMLLAVNYIHSHQVVHRDLKLDNFLYDRKGSSNLKLIDFGFSRIFEANTTMALGCGTLAYMAPEVLSKSYTSQCDLWSMGVISFILLAGYMPFAGDYAQQTAAILAGRCVMRPARWAPVSKQAKNFVDRLLVVDPAVRMTAAEALEHSFLQPCAGSDAGSEDGMDPVDSGVVGALTSFAEASKFRRACLSMMAWSLTAEERDKVREAFIAMDTSKQGTITLGELRRAVASQFEVTDEELKPIFEALDSGKNEEINYSEFLAAMCSTRIMMHDELLASTFRRFDCDRSGYITVENLRAVLGESFDGEKVDRLIKEADFKNDNQISYEEFLRYLQGGQAATQEIEAAVAIIDEEVSKRTSGPDEDSMVLRRSLQQCAKRSSAQSAEQGHHTWPVANVAAKYAYAGGDSMGASRSQPVRQRSRSCSIL